MIETALVDTGFWIALFDETDEHYQSVGAQAELLGLVTVIIPWPILYETLRTRLARRPGQVIRLDRQMKRPNVQFVDDRDYREEAYSLAVEYSTRRHRPISMVDMLCRLLIADPNVRIDYLLTTNSRDFADVCADRGVELL